MDINVAILIGFIVSAGLNVFMMFRVYNAVPREALNAILDFGGRRAAETPGTTDDEVIDLLKAINDWIKAQPPTVG